jgi:hypothetical protein
MKRSIGHNFQLEMEKMPKGCPGVIPRYDFREWQNPSRSVQVNDITIGRRAEVPLFWSYNDFVDSVGGTMRSSATAAIHCCL